MKGYGDGSNLKKHVALHERKKLIEEGKSIDMVKCDQCGKEFHGKLPFYHHEQTHRVKVRQL